MTHPQFLQVEAWRGESRIAHGFGMRHPGSEKPSRKDWQGRAVMGGDQAMPLLALRQVHGDRIVLFNGNPRGVEEIWGQEGDALVTRSPGFALGVFTADCLPVFLYDPAREAVGIVHAGWRGTARGLARKAVEAMKERFHSRAEDVLAALGPCIGPCCYEVDDPVKGAFSQSGLPWPAFSQSRGGGKWLLDLWAANLFLLEAAGVPKKNMETLKICTSCRGEAFYSYRNADKAGGRQLNFIALKKRQ